MVEGTLRRQCPRALEDPVNMPGKGAPRQESARANLGKALY